jgi:hypothetical protein
VGFDKKYPITGYDFVYVEVTALGEMGYEKFSELKRWRRASLNKVGCNALRYAPTFHRNMLPPP